jgi:hypothetical protein
MIRIVEFQPEHIEQIELKPCHRTELKDKTVTTYAITFLKEDRPIAIFGGYCPLEGVMQFWGMVSDGVRECPVAFHKTCKSFLEFYQSKYTLRRMQINVRVDYPEGYRWAKALGFELEGVMKKYGPDGTDYALFGRTN